MATLEHRAPASNPGLVEQRAYSPQPRKEGLYRYTTMSEPRHRLSVARNPYEAPTRQSVCPLTPDKSWKTWTPHQLDPDIKVGQHVRRLGYEFVWSHLHETGASMQRLRRVGDAEADAALRAVGAKPKDDVFELVLEAARQEGLQHLCRLTTEPLVDPEAPALRRRGSSTSARGAAIEPFLRSVYCVPKWVDWDAVQRGQDVFVRYGPAACMCLFYLSLVGGFSAPKINKVLTSTGYLNADQVMRRIYETFSMIVDCMEHGALRPGGKGWLSCLRVRFLHAKVRRRLLEHRAWDVEEWGVPINQEDLGVTQVSFSYNVVLGIEAMGTPVTQQERDDYTHLWRYIGYLMGIHDDVNPCRSFAHSKAYLESCGMHVLEPDETSVVMAHHNLRALANVAPTYWSYETNAQISRELMGDPMADRLRLPHSLMRSWLIKGFFAQLWLMSRLTYVPILGDIMLKTQRMFMRRLIDDRLGSRASFLMTHAPRWIDPSVALLRMTTSTAASDSIREKVWYHLLGTSVGVTLYLLAHFIGKSPKLHGYRRQFSFTKVANRRGLPRRWVGPLVGLLFSSLRSTKMVAGLILLRHVFSIVGVVTRLRRQGRVGAAAAVKAEMRNAESTATARRELLRRGKAGPSPVLSVSGSSTSATVPTGGASVPQKRHTRQRKSGKPASKHRAADVPESGGCPFGYGKVGS